MSTIPTTSITLLKDLSNGSPSVRWTDFYHRYEEPMRAFLRTRFPSVEADDILQETLLALMKALPNYVYTPDAHGHFRNYLIGIVKHKAEDALHRQSREAKLRNELREQPNRPEPEDASWKDDVLQVALDQLMADTTISPRTHEVFRQVALQHEPAETVAERFGLTANNVYQIKKRQIERLSALVAALTENA